MKFSDTVNRINKEHLKIQKNPIENVVAVPDPKNLFSWNFVIYGLTDCPFEGGVYHGILNLSPEYPMKPPSVKMITPNGRFKEGESICTTFTKFHPELWETSWNIEKMLIAMVSFMNDTEGSTGVVQTSTSEKRRLAKLSIPWNLQNNDSFTKLFKPYFKTLKIHSDNTSSNGSSSSNVKSVKSSQASSSESASASRLMMEKIIFVAASLFLIFSSYLYLKTSGDL